MPTSRKRALLWSTLGTVLLLAAFPVLAQSTDPVTWPGPNDPDDESTEVDPDNLVYTPTLGDPLQPSVEDDASLSAYFPPNDGDKTVVPLGLVSRDLITDAGTPNQHYLSYNNAPVVLVGVSADNACHFNVTGTGQCNYANYPTYLNDVASQGLNVIRLWVSIVGGSGSTTGNVCAGGTATTADTPFTYDGSHGTVNGVGHWYLDSKNLDFFNRLYNVVLNAASRNPPLFVEVTLFSPLTGLIGVGPYGAKHAYLTNQTQLRGFTDTANFTNVNSAEYLAMKPYVFNVIHWTVDKLYAFPNIYFEVANEPENLQLSATNPAGCGNSTETDPATVTAWQTTIAAELKSYETTHYVNTGKIARNHLVTVEPSTTTAADTFTASSAGSVVSSHYITLNPKGGGNPLAQVGLGAIKMIRKYNSNPKVFEFNETKITGATGFVTPSTAGSVDAARAEAWEFMADLGGVYNQYGYNCVSSDYTETRRQMGVLRSFLVNPAVNVAYGMKTSATDKPSWVNPGLYGNFESDTRSNKYWAALEPTSNATNKRWLLYVHHSLARNLFNDGYSAVLTSGRYQENLSVCLGPTPGYYNVRWVFDPKNALDSQGNFNSAAVHTDPPFFWPGAATCKPGEAGSKPLSPSPFYNYDLALSISPQ